MFDDPDFGELKLNIKVTDCDSRVLLNYSFEMFREQFDYKMPVNFMPMNAILKWLIKTYGEDAGRIIKWIWFKYNGETDGQVFAINWFNSKHQWWIDQEYGKLKKHLKAEALPVVEDDSEFISLGDLLTYGNTTR